MSLDLQKGMRKISEAQSAIISQYVTAEALQKKLESEDELHTGSCI